VSSTLRLSIIAVMLLATATLGLIAYNMMQPKAAPITVQAAPPPQAPPTPVYFVAKYPLTEGTLVHDHYLRPVPLAEAPSGAFTPDDMSKLRGSLIRKSIDAGNVITSQNVMLREDPAFFAAIEKLCHDANNQQKATITVYRYEGDPGRERLVTTDYSTKKTDAKASEACIELDATYPAYKVVSR
jgi:hypothetical protein